MNVSKSKMRNKIAQRRNVLIQRAMMINNLLLLTKNLKNIKRKKSSVIKIEKSKKMKMRMSHSLILQSMGPIFRNIYEISPMEKLILCD